MSYPPLKHSPKAGEWSVAEPPTGVDQLKTRQRATWSSGDYAVVGTTLQIVGEELCEALDLRAGQSVLDVAAGNGNVTLAEEGTTVTGQRLRADIKLKRGRLSGRTRVVMKKSLPSTLAAKKKDG